MNYRMFKIHNEEDFNRITRGIRVAQCMQPRSPSVSHVGRIPSQLEDLAVSDALSCSSCNAIFENKIQQRHHYKLDWHRYNLKQRLNGLKSVTEDGFTLLVDTGDVSSLSSSSDSELDHRVSVGILDIRGSQPSKCSKDNVLRTRGTFTSAVGTKKLEKQKKITESMSDSSDTECSEEVSDEKKIQALLAVASRHSKVFFENEDGNIFSIYRCLLHNKKEIPEVDNEMVAQALDSGKRTNWTIIMVGGGHFAAAVFQDGEPVVHKTFHSYTVRAKQGTMQSFRDSRTSGNHLKSAGASLRRYNEMTLAQHVQEILESWAAHINNSSLILYRAVGPSNRTVLFGGKNPPFEKNDSRLRPLPFPTRRATFNEVKRVYDVLSTMEIYGSAADFKDCFPISPRQPIRKKMPRTVVASENSSVRENAAVHSDVRGDTTCDTLPLQTRRSERSPTTSQASPDKQPRSNHRTPIDRAKPRKSPNRPLPDIVARLARSSSESEYDGKGNATDGLSFTEHTLEVDLHEHLSAFENSVTRNSRNKKTRRQKRSTKKEESETATTVVS